MSASPLKRAGLPAPKSPLAGYRAADPPPAPIAAVAASRVRQIVRRQRPKPATPAETAASAPLASPKSLGRTNKPTPETLAGLPRIAELREMGRTYREIGAELGLSKNQVLGIAFRAGLCEPTERPAAKPSTAFPERGCLWPQGDPGTPDFHFCGAAKDPDGRYCAAHHQRAYLSGARAQRAAQAIETAAGGNVFGSSWS